MRLLLISNSASPGESYLEKPASDIKSFLGDERSKEVVFIPFAGVTFSFDEYVEKVNKALSGVGVTVKGIHTFENPIKAIMEAKAIMVGGGNTFQLTKMMQEQGLIQAIREAVKSGTPYLGWSAGSNVACPTLCTTNDMPILEPISFEALNLIPFQINPHYLDAHPTNHGGETREQRLLEYIAANRDMYVAGLREGSRFLIEDDKITLKGENNLRVFKYGEEIKEYKPSEDLSFLMKR
ncbi:dipeptidase PepE [Porphyromonadaceae bacterium W3.11]|nr:dipeptidase PepE [Porphyromonadaceae bacterium W3.11]